MFTLTFFINSMKIGLISNKKFIYFPVNKLVVKFLKFLFVEGLLYKVIYDKKTNKLKIFFKYSSLGYSIIQDIKILSKITKHHYIKLSELVKVSKIGIFLVSTPFGLFSNYDCLKLGLGGKLICFIK